MHQTDMLDWDETDAAEGAMQPPQMVINVVSNDVLQMTVTRTALDVFTNLSQVDNNQLSFVCVTHFVPSENWQTVYQGWSTSNEKNLIEYFHSEIHYTCWLAYFLRPLHENTLVYDIILVARQCLRRFFSGMSVTSNVKSHFLDFQKT